MDADTCPACCTDLVPFADLPTELRESLELDPSRRYQSVAHRRERRAACPECTIELHGCGQPYALPAETVPDTEA